MTCTLTGILRDGTGAPFGPAEIILRPAPPEVVVTPGGSIVVPVTLPPVWNGADGATVLTLEPGHYFGEARGPTGQVITFALPVPDLASAPLEDYIGRQDVVVLTSAQAARDAALVAQAGAEAQAASAGGSAAIALAAEAGAVAAKDAVLIARLAEDVFDTTGEGLAATAVGEGFFLEVPDGVALYVHDTGDVARYVDTIANSSTVLPRLNAAGVREAFAEGDLTYRWVVRFADNKVAWAQRATGRLEGEGLGFQTDFFLGDAQTEVVDDPRYVQVWKTSDGITIAALNRQGQLVTFAGGPDAADALHAPTWVQGWDSLVPVLMSGQSLSIAQKASLPADLYTALQLPVVAGRALTFGTTGPRCMANHNVGTAAAVTEATLRRLSDHAEATAGLLAATSSWTAIKGVAAAQPNAAFVTFATGVGGSNITEVNTGPSRLSRRRAYLAARRFADRKMTAFGRAGALLWDHGNVNKADTLTVHKALLRSVFAEIEADFASAGGIVSSPVAGEGFFEILTASAGVTSVSVYASDVPLAQLALALEDPRVALACPEYIAEMAIGDYAVDGSDDPIHRSALGQARIGVYQARALAAMLAGTKRAPLYCPGTATRGGGNTTVSWTYANPEAGSLSIDTTLVSNPATDGVYQAVDTRRPFGVMLADATGKAPHATLTVTGVAVAGNVVTATLSGALTDPATAMINVANYCDNGANEAQGTRHGARACIRNTVTGADVTVAGYTITPHDYVVPQRITIT